MSNFSNFLKAASAPMVFSIPIMKLVTSLILSNFFLTFPIFGNVYNEAFNFEFFSNFFNFSNFLEVGSAPMVFYNFYNGTCNFLNFSKGFLYIAWHIPVALFGLWKGLFKPAKACHQPSKALLRFINVY